MDEISYLRNRLEVKENEENRFQKYLLSLGIDKCIEMYEDITELIEFDQINFSIFEQFMIYDQRLSCILFSMLQNQENYVKAFLSNYFNNYRDLKLVNRREYIILMLLLKKKLLIEAGYDKDSNEFTDCILPYILTGNLEESVNTRLIRNNKFISKLQPNSMYRYLIEKKYKHIQEIKPDVILSLLSSIINTNFTYVVYERQDMLGKPIEYNEDRISDELLFFLKNI